jgi:hypothetical protein
VKFSNSTEKEGSLTRTLSLSCHLFGFRHDLGRVDEVKVWRNCRRDFWRVRAVGRSAGQKRARRTLEQLWTSNGRIDEL